MSNTLTHRAAHATWWSALEIMSRYGVQIIVMVVLARLLTPSDFGMIAMLLVFTSIAMLLVDSGFGTALVQKQQTSDNDETTVFLSCLAVGVLASVLLWLAASAIARFYAQPMLEPLTKMLVVVLPLSALAAVPDALLTQRLDFRARAKAEIVASLCSGTLAVILAWRGFGVWSLVWQAISNTGIRMLLLWNYARWRPRGRFDTCSFRALFGFGSYMLLANLLNVISIRLQSLLIGKLYDSRALGYYILAQNTQQAPAQFMSGVLNRVGLPVFSTVADRPEKLLEALRLSLRASCFIFVPCMVGIAVVAKPLIVMLYGERWIPAAPLLTLLALSAALWPLHVLNLAAIGARGRSDLIFRLEMVKRTAFITAILIASAWGPLAVAWAVLASSLFGVIVNTWYSQRLLGYGTLAQLQDQLGTLMLSLPAALAGWLALHWLHPGTIAMLIAIFTAAVVYVGSAYATRNRALNELLNLLHTLRTPERRVAP